MSRLVDEFNKGDVVIVRTKGAEHEGMEGLVTGKLPSSIVLEFNAIPQEQAKPRRWALYYPGYDDLARKQP